MEDIEKTGNGLLKSEGMRVIASWLGFFVLVAAVVGWTLVYGTDDAPTDKPGEKAATASGPVAR